MSETRAGPALSLAVRWARERWVPSAVGAVHPAGVGSLLGWRVAAGGRGATLGALRGSGLLEHWDSLSRVKQVLLAQAEAEKIRKLGEAEAFVIEATGKAEAERMKLKAEALKQYGEAAQLALVLDALPEVRRGQLPPALDRCWVVPRLGWVCWGLREAPAGCRALAQQPGQQLLGSLLTPLSSPAPQIAAKVAAPLSKVDEIVILSGQSSNTVSEVNRLLAEIPASVRAITGVDLTKVSRAPALQLWGHR